MIELFLLLVVMPLVAWGGWRLGRRRGKHQDDLQVSRYSNRYFRGLNYLLNEQPDKAIEVFLKLAEVNQDTVETHFALGNLFRRRGEVDRAIRFHQNIIAKPGLNDKQRTRALLELGEDYMRAGLLDRAERLFAELVEQDAHTPSALNHLLDIYQQEKDWDLAIEIARRIEQATNRRMGPVMAHFCCELAASARERGDVAAARQNLRQARRYHANAVRPRVMEAQLLMQDDKPAEAAQAFRDAIDIDPGMLPELLGELNEAMSAAGQQQELLDLLQQHVAEHHGATATIAVAERLAQSEGPERAAEWIMQQLAGRPSVRGVAWLLEQPDLSPLASDSGGDILRGMTRRILDNESRYRCRHCGFGGHQYHWQCPSCRHWDTTQRIVSVSGE